MCEKKTEESNTHLNIDIRSGLFEFVLAFRCRHFLTKSLFSFFLSFDQKKLNVSGNFTEIFG